jgi:hypothetical protein
MDGVLWHFERRGSAWALGILLGIGLLSGQQLRADAIDRAWQTAIAPVTLNLRNKLAEAPYSVTFIVEALSNGAQWQYTTDSAPNAWQRPQFPRDFDGPRVDHLRPQAYTWHARVGTKRVLGGQFTYPNGSFSAQLSHPTADPTPGVLLAEFDQLFAERYAITLQLLPEQVQGGPYLSCLASIRITDTHNGRQGLLLSSSFSLPEASLRPYVEQVREPEYAERIHPGVHRVPLKTSDYSHALLGEGAQTLQFERGFAFADLDHDGQLELFIAQFMAGQRMRTAYSVYALEALSAGEHTQLDPIDDPALRDLDSASTLNLAAQTLSNHSSGSAYDSLTERYQLLPRHKNPPAAQFDQRQRYHLTSVSGASTTDAPPGQYYQVDRRYRYTPAADGSWQQQVITIHEVLHPID